VIHGFQLWDRGLVCAAMCCNVIIRLIDFFCRAIQAARQYPFAEVLAVDSAPLPDR
jgi:hypothetical protein